MNDDEDNGLLPIGQLVMKGQDGKETQINPVDLGPQVIIHEPGWWDEWGMPRPFGPQVTQAFNQEVINLCRAKAVEHAKCDEFLDTVATYRPYVTREDALAILALARVGIDTKAIETVFMLGLQKEREEDAARMEAINRNVEAMARACGLTADKAAAQAMVGWPPGSIFSPSPHLDQVKLDFTGTSPYRTQKP